MGSGADLNAWIDRLLDMGLTVDAACWSKETVISYMTCRGSEYVLEKVFGVTPSPFAPMLCVGSGWPGRDDGNGNGYGYVFVKRQVGFGYGDRLGDGCGQSMILRGEE